MESRGGSVFERGGERKKEGKVHKCEREREGGRRVVAREREGGRRVVAREREGGRVVTRERESQVYKRGGGSVCEALTRRDFPS